MLKVTVPHDEARHEGDALLAWRGQGAVRVLEHDRDGWALLLERCLPGTTLATVGVPEADGVEIVGALLPLLWSASIDASYRTLGEEMARQAVEVVEWSERWPGTVDAALVDRARCHLAGGPDTAAPVLLHRDLHGGNILAGDRGWLAIDPKPILGERAYDLASPLVNQLPGSVDELARRLDLDASRVREHAVAKAVMLALWDRSVGRVDAARHHAERARLLAGSD